jgi:hypothetical protein
MRPNRQNSVTYGSNRSEATVGASVKNPPGFMVFGAITRTGKSKLYFVKGVSLVHFGSSNHAHPRPHIHLAHTPTGEKEPVDTFITSTIDPHIPPRKKLFTMGQLLRKRFGSGDDCGRKRLCGLDVVSFAHPSVGANFQVGLPNTLHSKSCMEWCRWWWNQWGVSVVWCVCAVWCGWCGCGVGGVGWDVGVFMTSNP